MEKNITEDGQEYIKIQGKIINYSIKIEQLISEVILVYFKPSNRKVFISHILDSTVMHYGGKLKVLSGIGLDSKVHAKLLRIGSIRNSFAHANISKSINLNFDPNDVVLDEIFSDRINVMNTKGIIKSKKAIDLLEEFLLIYEEVGAELKKLKIQLNIKI